MGDSLNFVTIDKFIIKKQFMAHGVFGVLQATEWGQILACTHYDFAKEVGRGAEHLQCSSPNLSLHFYTY